MLQNITLLNSVQNNAGLALDVQGADHRTNLRVEPARPEVAGTSEMRVLPVRMLPERVDAVAFAFEKECERWSAETLPEHPASSGKRPCEGDSQEQRARTASPTRGSRPGAIPALREDAAMPRPQISAADAMYQPAARRGTTLPAAIWASLVLSRV